MKHLKPLLTLRYALAYGLLVSLALGLVLVLLNRLGLMSQRPEPIHGLVTLALSSAFFYAFFWRELGSKRESLVKRQEAEGLLQAYIDITVDAVLIVGPEGNILQCNHGAELIFGAPAAQIAGTAAARFLPQERLAAAAENSTGRRGGQPVEVSARRMDGAPFPAEMTTAHLDSDGRRLLIVVLRDMTAYRWAEEALRTSEERYRLLAENTADMITSFEADGRISYISPAVERMLGYRPDEVIGLYEHELLHPEDVFAVLGTLKKAFEQQATEPPPVIYRARHKQGHYVWLETIYETVRSSTPVPGASIIAVSRDITRRKQDEAALQESETRYRLLAENTTDMITLQGADGYLKYVSPAVRSLLSYEPDELLGHMLAEFYHPEDLEKLSEVYLHTLQDQTITYRFTGRVRRKNGEYIWLETASHTLNAGAAGRREIVSVSRDVTERVLLEAELRETLEHERELGEMKLSFTTMVSHEFRTPLTVIMSSSDILKNYAGRLAEDKRASHLDKIIRQTQYMRTLLDDVMFTSKAQSGRVEINPGPLDLVALCSDLCEEARREAGPTHELRFEHEGEFSGAVMDERLLQQIVANLLSNAVKYSPQGGTVLLRLARGGDEVLLHVRDEGIGIPQADRGKLFQPFSRGSNTEHVGGTGLGLAIVRASVELQGGSITLESEEGRGTSVSVRLPLVVHPQPV